MPTRLRVDLAGYHHVINRGVNRNTNQQTKAGKTAGIKDGLANDDGGHLIASMFDGLGEQINYLPMDKKVNRSGGEWYNLEQKWKNALKNGDDVKVNIKPIYSGDSKRPDKFEVVYTVNGGQTNF
jgi:predicted ribonuclease toxin of YeeF-YezG toxin-antitoxin module